MSPIGPPIQPARLGSLFNAEVDIASVSSSVGDGGVGLSEVTSNDHTNVPCSFRPVSSSENENYGVEMNTTMYALILPKLSADGTDISVSGDGTQRRFVIGGVSYEPVGTSQDLADGMQKVMLKRLGE